jgi:hypothetical protein
MMKTQNARTKLILMILLPVLAWAIIFYRCTPLRRALRTITRSVHTLSPPQTVPTIRTEIKNTKKNYGSEIDRYSSLLGLPAPYFMALVIMECSGEKPAPHRFEPHVYSKLKALKAGKIKTYKNIKREDIKTADDDALRNLASSWGPFQIMGYHSISLKITVNELRGEYAVFWGMKWIERNYGEFLRSGEYRHAFHIHNTGEQFPSSGKAKTTNPNYVNNGLALMKNF